MTLIRKVCLGCSSLFFFSAFSYLLTSLQQQLLQHFLSLGDLVITYNLAPACCCYLLLLGGGGSKSPQKFFLSLFLCGAKAVNHFVLVPTVG
jgi:hypothetical protein